MPAGKYQPLTDWLVAARARGDQVLRLRFGEIEAIVGPLPASASTRTWWANSSHTQALAWAAADWHVSAVDLAAQRVEFSRGRKGGSYAARGFVPADGRRQQRGPRRTVPAPPTATGERERIEVEFEWLDAGPVTLASGGKLEFPRLEPVPGIYRLMLAGPAADARAAWYVGETDNLSRRSGNYRNPGPRQRTSLRLNGILIEHLRSGGTVTMHVATHVLVRAVGGEWQPLDLARKAGRLLAESAVLVRAQLEGEVELHNLG